MTPADPRPDLLDLDLDELQATVEARGLPRFRARQIFGWVYRRGATDFDAMSDLSLADRAALSGAFALGTLRLVHEDTSSDGTRKCLFELGDGRKIESVFIPDTPSQTFCISSQVGCAMDCAFCLTGRMGFVRNLAAGEIVGQVRELARLTGRLDKPFNIVLMGMGEPLHNYDAVMKALRILASPHGLALPPKRVTLSTVGVVPAMERLAREPLMPNLAVSLHGTTDAQRDALVPINRKYDLEALVEACRRFPLGKRSRITFEYVLLKGVNDTPADARRLVRLLGQLKAKVNLLPLNEAPGIEFERPGDDRVDRFAAILADHGLTVSVRKSRGRDIRAACGQLIVEGQKRTPAQRLAALI